MWAKGGWGPKNYNFCLLKCASFGCPKRHRRQRGPRECVLAPSLAVRCFAARARGPAASMGAPTPSTAFVSTKSRREVANKCTPVALLPGHHRAKLRASSCAIVTVLASREADPTVSAFRGDGASSTNFGAANACKTAPRAAANILRYPTLRGPRATEIAAGRGY